ncbi:hypothetical protein B0T17DRAFT_543828 [Bombardia bombarda]|uniref:Zn(2)-C6 fungal-type domain-containing protein n=1 Tax=Bombardia bombarda TaxID=252184 RepID=A0AA39TPL7_9PEZI|nr:hypothetical protein B0T17DRAFT_543828 [Bombardia bombarda]
MQAYRELRPAPQRPGDGDDDRNSSRNDESYLLRKKRSVVQACYDCRKTKAKCDGQRPRCGNCVGRGRDCGYDGEEGQSRYAATITHLNVYKQLIDDITNSSEDESRRMWQQLRTGETPRPGAVPVSSLPALAASLSLAGSSLAQRSTGGASSSHAATAHSASPSAPAVSGASSLSGQRTIHLQIPNESLTTKAVEGFFSSSGKLFHVFSREQVDRCYRTVFETNLTEPDQASQEVAVGSDRGEKELQRKASTCCLMAVAAVGAQYIHGTLDQETEDACYDVARHYLDSVIEHQPLDAVKVCVLLAMYNIMNKSTLALVYVESGLSMAARHGLDSRSAVQQHPLLSPAQWVDYRKTWRTLVFLASWLTCTLGYISGNDISSGRNLLAEMEVDTSADLTELVQAEMTKICLLKADILRMHLAFRDLSVLSLQNTQGHLQRWYRNLPMQVDLEYVARNREAIPTEARRSIYHVHLLYLGAVMLLYRRLASQSVRSYGIDKDRQMLVRPLEKVFIEHAGEAVRAASSSAKILMLLLEEQGIFVRCWLVIFQTYTSCVVLLHSAAQKQAHNFDPSTWQDEIDRSRDCLAVLKYCGAHDPVAANFHTQLTPICDQLAAAQTRTQGDIWPPGDARDDGDGRMDVDAREKGKEPAADDSSYLLTLPTGHDAINASRVKLSLSLLLMLCRPFGGRVNKPGAEANIKDLWHGDPTRYEHVHMIDRLDWDFENSEPFEWNVGGLGLGSQSSRAARVLELEMSYDAGPKEPSVPLRPLGSFAGHRFLGSAQPSGWASSRHSGIFPPPRSW